ncbi:single-stranded DNA-binding protein [Campylobacter hyointestinalis subsp. lawsonii]|nr:single-stranded DNA-binding protein [Campylobacter hyointestinalis]RAZ25756.1 single-stranded DNA-binding protein [Campylobacter hyointestinalis subsp. lawsonii]RAZ40156.1 single-stranded DNA-binding protein [Campylobacter hyointestinalis subsp. lawsonii]
MHTYISVIGNLTRDIELRYTQSGLAIGNTAIASTHKYSINGEKREETCFIDIAFMGKTAEIASQYLQKGSKVFIDGRLKFDQWTDNNGLARSKHSIVVDKMLMLDSKKQDSNEKEPQQHEQHSQDSQPDVSEYMQVE